MNRHRPPIIVLWGGRPGIDIQAGSARDRHRQRLLNATTRIGRSMTELSRAIGIAFAPTLKRTVEAVQAFNDAAERIYGLEEASVLSRARIDALANLGRTTR